MAPDDACCTCASHLSPPSYEYADEKKTSHKGPPRQLPCCSRYICSDCMRKNSRFETYCPFCQVTSEPSKLPQGLRDPPTYSSPSSSPKRKPADPVNDEPPAYNSLDQSSSSQQDDVVHHLRPDDTISSISIAYNVPAGILRSHNTMFADHLISARRTISVPASHYQGPSLSNEPVESEEETERKSRIRRFMMQTKCHEYNVAELYLKNAGDGLEKAVRVWEDDEKWERENPMKKMTTGRKGGVGGGLTSQLR